MFDINTIWQLRRPFPAHAHEFRSDGLVYLDKEHIIIRLNEVEPEWRYHIVEQMVVNDAVIVRGSMTVCGITRDAIAGDVIQKSSNGKLLPEYKISDNTVRAFKSADTDLIQRLAQKFLIGWYLKRSPNERAHFNGWLADYTAKFHQAYQMFLESDPNAVPPEPDPVKILKQASA